MSLVTAKIVVKNIDSFLLLLLTFGFLSFPLKFSMKAESSLFEVLLEVSPVSMIKRVVFKVLEEILTV